MSLLIIIYWVLLVLVAVGAIAPASSWEYWPRANAVVTLVLFVIIGLKLLKPNW